jgi:hypothetical protein
MKEGVDTQRIDKSAFSVISLSDQMADSNYWLNKAPSDRLRHIELLRRINYGSRATSRLQRVFEYTSG